MTGKLDKHGHKATYSIVVLLALNAFAVSHRVPGLRELRELVRRSELGRTVDRILNVSRDRNRTSDEMAGYYEDLLNQDAKTTGANILIAHGIVPRSIVGDMPVNIPLEARKDSFVMFELARNVRVPDSSGFAVFTNSQRMFDREYPLHASPEVRRIAIFGDSLTRGFGVHFGSTYEALLEKALAAEKPPKQKYELMNMAVDGYRSTQVLAAMEERVPVFRPDVCVVALTHVMVSETWSHHLWQVAQSSLKVPYSFITETFLLAGVTSQDDYPTFEEKMAPFRISLLRSVLLEMKGLSKRHSARLILLLVPSLDDPQVLAKHFEGVRELAAELGIPYIDILNTFSGVSQRGNLRVNPRDRHHPNEEGNQLLFKALYNVVQHDPCVRAVLLDGTDEQLCRSTTP